LKSASLGQQTRLRQNSFRFHAPKKFLVAWNFLFACQFYRRKPASPDGFARGATAPRPLEAPLGRRETLLRPPETFLSFTLSKQNHPNIWLPEPNPSSQRLLREQVF